MQFNFRNMVSPKHIGQVTWLILQQNPIQYKTYICFILVELALMLFYASILITRVHYQNFEVVNSSDGIKNNTADFNSTQNNSTSTVVSMVSSIDISDYEDQGRGISLKFIRDIDIKLDEMVHQHPDFLFVFTIVITVVCFLVLIGVFLQTASTRNHSEQKEAMEKDEKSFIINKILCFVLISIKTYLHMPMFDILMRTLLHTYNTADHDLLTQITRYTVCTLGTIMFGVVMFYIFRIFHIFVPSDILPWCAPCSKLNYLTLFMKVFVILSVAIDIDGSLAIVEVTFLMFMLSFQSGYRILFVPQYRPEVDFVIKSKDFMLTLIFFIGVICRLIKDTYQLDIVYFLIFSVVVSIAWTTADHLRKKQMLQKIKNQRGQSQNLQLEADNEYALYVMAQLLSDSIGHTANSNKYFGQLLDLLFAHIDECQEMNCICNEMENYNELLQLRQQHNQEIFPLLYEQRMHFKRIIDDQGLIDTVSTFSETTLRNNPLSAVQNYHQASQKDAHTTGAYNSIVQNSHPPLSYKNRQQTFTHKFKSENEKGGFLQMPSVLAPISKQQKSSSSKQCHSMDEEVQSRGGFASITKEENPDMSNLQIGELPTVHDLGSVPQSMGVPGLIKNPSFIPPEPKMPVDTQNRSFLSENQSPNHSNEKNQLESQQVFKVNINETQHRFLSELVYLFFYDILLKFPESSQIQLFANYFSLKFRRKELLCIFQLRNFPKNKLSFFDHVCYTVNEQYLLWEIEQIEQKGNGDREIFKQNESNSKINGDYFIRINSLYEEFSLSIETLGQTVVGFWRNLQRPEINVKYSIKTATQIANNTRKVFDLFNELDNLKIFKDYQTYFQLSLVQQHILNDQVGSQLYLGKMKSILEINQVYHKNFAQTSAQSNENSNFLIVDANGSRFGRIILFNSSLRQLLGFTDQEIRNLSIEELMPQPIQQKHSAFLKRFAHTGQSFIINNKASQFIKRRNGYVIPIELFIKFHHSIDYQYTFLAILKPFYEIAPFANQVKYHTDQLMFLIADNDVEGSISEYSESSQTLLRQFGIKLKAEQSAISKRISDVIVDLDFTQVRDTREERAFNKEVYEATHVMDLSQFYDIADIKNNPVDPMNFGDVNFKSGLVSTSELMYQQTHSQFHNNLQQNQYVRVRTRIFEERYSGGILDLNIFCFTFIQDQCDGNGPSIMFQSGMLLNSGARQQMVSNGSNQKTRSIMIGGSQARQEYDTSKVVIQPIKVQREQQKQLKEQQQQQQKQQQEQEEHYNEEQDDTNSATGSSSSAFSTANILAEFSSVASLTEQKTPRTLNIIVRLIILLYVIMMGIASLNLGINITKQQQSELDIHTVKLAYDRQGYLATNLVLFRVLVNIANGYEPGQSSISADRFWRYQLLQDSSINGFKKAQAELQKSGFSKSLIFEHFENTQNVELSYLSAQNDVYTSKEFLNVAFNTYIAKLNEINKFSKQQLQGNLATQKLNGFRDGDIYSPTNNEKDLYFIAQNGILPLRRAVIDSCFLYASEASDHANANITTTLLTALVSIISIIVIGLVLSPMLSQAETRRYKALHYFIKLPKKAIQVLLDNIEHYCLHLRDETRYQMIQREYERALGIKLVKQQIEQLWEQDNQYDNPIGNAIDSQKVSISSSNDFQSSSFGSRPYSNRVDNSQQHIVTIGVNNNNMIPSENEDDEGNGNFYGGDTFAVQASPQQKKSSNKCKVLDESFDGDAFGFNQNKVGGINDENSSRSPAQKPSKHPRRGVQKGQQKGMNSNQGQNDQTNEQIQMTQQFPSVATEGASKMNVAFNQQQDENCSRDESNDHDLSQIQLVMQGETTRDLAESYRQRLRQNTQRNQRSENSSSQYDSDRSSKISADAEEGSAQREVNSMIAKALVIKRSILNKQIVMIATILSLISLLSTYFVISYFLSIRTFNTASDVINELETVFQKSSCFDFSIAFIRANEIRNATLKVRSATENSFGEQTAIYYPASDYYIDLCAQKENEYRKMRMALPAFFQGAANFMNDLESSQFCEIMYTGPQFKGYREICDQALNGILHQGLSNAFSHMSTQLLKSNLNFNELGETADRDEDFLRSQMGDPILVEIIDSKAKLIDPILDELNLICMSSVVTYVRSLLTDSLTAFIVFTIFLTAGLTALMIFGFRIMKRNMLDTNIVLRIIPFELLTSDDVDQLKEFFKQ